MKVNRTRTKIAHFKMAQNTKLRSLFEALELSDLIE